MQDAETQRTWQGIHVRATVWVSILFWKIPSAVSFSLSRFLPTDFSREELEGSAGATDSFSQKP